MVYLRSRLDVADNSGARMATMIGVIGKGGAQCAGIGDVISANVKGGEPDRNGEKGRSGSRGLGSHQAADPAR